MIPPGCLPDEGKRQFRVEISHSPRAAKSDSREGPMRRSLFAGALAASASLAAATHALSASLEGFGPAGQAACRLCEASSNLREKVTGSIPQHAIVLDFGNGVFWRNNRLIVIDLDHAVARTYRFPPEDQSPTTLSLMASRSLSADVVRGLTDKANVIWSPPLRQGPPPLPVPDRFETVYVVNGPVMATWLGGSNDPSWAAALTDAIRAVQAG